MPSTTGVLLLMLLLTARRDDPYGLIQTGWKKLDLAWLPVLSAAHAVVSAGTKTDDAWFP